MSFSCLVDPFSPDLLASYNISDQLAAIEDIIALGADIQTVLRLLCLASITSGGIKAKTLENLEREILQVLKPALGVSISFLKDFSDIWLPFLASVTGALEPNSYSSFRKPSPNFNCEISVPSSSEVTTSARRRQWGHIRRSRE